MCLCCLWTWKIIPEGTVRPLQSMTMNGTGHCALWHPDNKSNNISLCVRLLMICHMSSPAIRCPHQQAHPDACLPAASWLFKSPDAGKVFAWKYGKLAGNYFLINSILAWVVQPQTIRAEQASRSKKKEVSWCNSSQCQIHCWTTGLLNVRNTPHWFFRAATSGCRCGRA